MKKFFFTMCAAALAMSAQADVVTFVAEGAETCPDFEAITNTKVVMPTGFYMKGSARAPKVKTTKSLVSDNVMISPAGPYSNSMVFAGGWRWYTGTNHMLTFEPAAGMKITKIRALAQSANANNGDIINNDNADQKFTKDATDGRLSTLTCDVSTSITLRTSINSWYQWIEVTTEGNSTQVALPVLKNTEPVIAASEKIELTCPTEGAQIYYTVSYDGTELTPTTESTLYTAPFAIEKDAIIRAIAVKDDMTQSFPIYQEYYVVPDGLEVGMFDFVNYNTLVRTTGAPLVPATNGFVTDPKNTQYYYWRTIPIINNGAIMDSESTVSFYLFRQPETGNWFVDWSSLVNATFRLNAPEGRTLEAIYFEGSLLNCVYLNSGQDGYFDIYPYNDSKGMWTPEEGKSTQKVEFVCESHSGVADKVVNPTDTKFEAPHISKIYVFFNEPVLGIENVAVDENAPVEYYNLQGVRVANPQGGIYVKRQGNKATKILVK
jgi:hypothetical protein